MPYYVDVFTPSDSDSRLSPFNDSENITNLIPFLSLFLYISPLLLYSTTSP